MKKIFVLCLGVFLLTACNNNTEEVTCTINSEKAVFTLKNGIITKYTLDSKSVKQNEIDEINGEYFTSATNNEEGKEALNTYINSIGGTCS